MIDRRKLLEGLQLSQHLPLKFQGKYDNVMLQTFDGKVIGFYSIDIVPSRGHGKHRIFINCLCGRKVPFGRYFQHSCDRRILK